MDSRAEGSIEYLRADGRTGTISPEDVAHVSELSDGRGGVYTRRGDLIVISRAAEFLGELRRRAGN